MEEAGERGRKQEGREESIVRRREREKTLGGQKRQRAEDRGKVKGKTQTAWEWADPSPNPTLRASWVLAAADGSSVQDPDLWWGWGCPK